jgi:hypothetical protein
LLRLAPRQIAVRFRKRQIQTLTEDTLKLRTFQE